MGSSVTLGYDESNAEKPAAAGGPPTGSTDAKGTIGYEAPDPRVAAAPAVRPRPAVSAFARPATPARAPRDEQATAPNAAVRPAPGVAFALDATVGVETASMNASLAASTHDSLAATLAVGDSLAGSTRESLARSATTDAATTARTDSARRVTTVLPRVEGDGDALRLVATDRVRYESVKTLGAGGMGEVALARDHDIDRQVAVKRLLPEMQNAPTMARFVDEIRIVGSLEHPNIVPIHDVGVDENGRYFFVMKFVDGETLETIIERLDAGDPAYHAKYTFEKRRDLFAGLLRALQFAHSRGIVHRDIKPANVMIGRYGEVVLMDWGIAKPMAGRDSAALDGGSVGAAQGADANALVAGSETNNAGVTAATAAPGATKSAEKARMFKTRHGALIGTPAYMSPEQARGQNDKIDARSDVFSATVLFHELIGLKHYLASKENIAEVLHEIAEGDVPPLRFADFRHPHQPLPPAELIHFVRRGMRRDPDKRWQSTEEMLQELQNMAEGKVRVQCPFTMTKRMTREASRFVDRYPIPAVAAFFMVVGLVLLSIVQLVRTAV